MLLDGEIVEKEHHSWHSLEMARIFFSRPFRRSAQECWSFSPEYRARKGSSVLDKFVSNTISFHCLLELISQDKLPLLGVIRSLRNLKNAVKSPEYLFCEVEDTVAPQRMIKAFEALPEESERKLTPEGDNEELFETVADLNIVADFFAQYDDRAKR